MSFSNKKLSYSEKKSIGTDFTYLCISFFGSCLIIYCLFDYLYIPAIKYLNGGANATFLNVLATYVFTLFFWSAAMHLAIAPFLSIYEFVTQKRHKKKILKIDGNSFYIKEPTRELSLSWKELERIEIHENKGKRTLYLTRRFVNEEFHFDITDLKFDEAKLKQLIAAYSTMENLRRTSTEPVKDTVYDESGSGIYKFSPLPYKTKPFCNYLIIVSVCFGVVSMLENSTTWLSSSVLSLAGAAIAFFLGQSSNSSAKMSHLNMSDKGIYFFDAKKNSAFYADWYNIDSMDFSPRPDFRFFSSLAPFLGLYSICTLAWFLLTKLAIFELSFESVSILALLAYSFLLAIRTHRRRDVPPAKLIVYQKKKGTNLVDLSNFDDFNYFTFAKEVNRRARREIFSTSKSFCKRWTSMRSLHVVISMTSPCIFCIIIFWADNLIQNFANWILD